MQNPPILTEHRIRQEIESIAAAPLPPPSRARRFLRLGRSLKAQFQRLQFAKERPQSDPNVRASVARLAGAALSLREELRERAMDAMRGSRN